MADIRDNKSVSITLSDYLTEQETISFYPGFAERLYLAIEFMNSVHDIYTDCHGKRTSSGDVALAQKKLKLIPFLNINNLTIRMHDVDDEMSIPIRQYEVEIPSDMNENSKVLFQNYAYADKELLSTKPFIGAVRESTNEDVYKNKSVNIVTTISRILFYILFCCHPFYGKDYFSKIARTEQEERKFFLDVNKFIFEVENNPNRFINGYHNKAWCLWQCLTEKQRLFWIDTFANRCSDYETFYSNWISAYDNFYLTYSQTVCGHKIPTIVYSNDKHYIILSDSTISIKKFRCNDCLDAIANACKNCAYSADKQVIDILSVKLKFQSKSKENEGENSNDILTEKELTVFNGMQISESDFPNGKDTTPIFTTIASKKGDLLGLKLVADRTIVACCGNSKREYSNGGLIALLPGTQIPVSDKFTIIVPGTPIEQTKKSIISQQTPNAEPIKVVEQKHAHEIKKVPVVNELTVVTDKGNYYNVDGERISLSDGAFYTVTEMVSQQKCSLKIFSNRVNSVTIENIRRLISQNIATEHLLYPKDLIKSDQGYGKGKDGYVFDKLDNLTSPIDKIFDGSISLSLVDKIKIMIQLCDEIKLLHKKGLAYKVFSKENFRIDAKINALYLVNNDAVSDRTYNPQAYNATNLYARYTAPEVFSDNCKLDIYSDYYAVATIIFMTLYNIHPIDGFMSCESAKFTQEQRDYYYISRPQFIFDGFIQHTFQNRIPQASKKLWQNTPNFLRELFCYTFVDSISFKRSLRRDVPAAREKRATLEELIIALNSWLTVLEKNTQES